MGYHKNLAIEYMNMGIEDYLWWYDEEQHLIECGELLPPEKNCSTELRDEVIVSNPREYFNHKQDWKGVMKELVMKSVIKDWMKQTDAIKKRAIALYMNSNWGKY